MKFDPSNGLSNRDTRRIRKNEFALTVLSEAPLFSRLLAEIEFVFQRLKQSWPEFKKEPVKFTRSAARNSVAAVQHEFSGTQRGLAVAMSVLIITSAIVAVLVLERRSRDREGGKGIEQLEVVTTFTFPSTSDAAKDPGTGTGENGRVGLARGAGEGSSAIPARAHGGGSGGNHDPLPVSQGRVPLPSIIPAPIPTAAVRLPQALPVAGIDLDPALYRKIDYSTYGDPRSKQTTPSNGPGDGGGVGTHDGTGIGNGSGGGFGDGNDGNTGGGDRSIGLGGSGGGPGCGRGTALARGCTGTDRIYKSPEVSARPRVISKPEPQYTEQARRNQITGTVVLRVVFSSSGEVTNIQAVQKLSDGLTEKAIAAARQIHFVPAMRDGRPVSMYMQLEYNFNLY
jgi:TonB family protein